MHWEYTRILCFSFQTKEKILKLILIKYVQNIPYPHEVYDLVRVYIKKHTNRGNEGVRVINILQFHRNNQHTFVILYNGCYIQDMFVFSKCSQSQWNLC